VIRVRANGIIVFVPKFGIEAPVLFEAPVGEGEERKEGAAAAGAVLDEAGLYKLRMQPTHNSKPPGYNPCKLYKVMSWFLNPLLSHATCTPLHLGGDDGDHGGGEGGTTGCVSLCMTPIGQPCIVNQ
jgi:hypothetical protein